MKTIFILLLLSAIPWSGRQPHAAEPGNWALLIGVGRYADRVQYPDLAVTNGIPLLQRTLQERGFPERNITTLVNEQATHQSIVETIQDEIIGKVAEGDIVIIHFTGHGKSVADDNGDETDSEDESIVPFDGQIIRDDALGKLLTLIRRKVGPSGQVLVLLDACQSGTGTRSGDGLVKRALTGTRFKRRFRTETQAAPMVAFFASQSFELTYQMQGSDGLQYGPLTYAFCQAMEQVDAATSYRGLFDQIAWIISVGNGIRHTPQAEGDLDLAVFGGKMPAPPPYFKSKLVLDTQHALIDAGLLKGLNPGTEMVLYPVDTRDTTSVRPLAVGRLQTETKTSLLESVIRFNQQVPPTQVEQGWFFVRQRQFDGYDLNLTSRIADPAVNDVVQSLLAGMPAVRQDASKSPELLLVQGSRKDKLELLTPDSLVLYSTKISVNNPDAGLHGLQEAVGNFAQAQFLRELQFKDSPYQITMSVSLANTLPAAGVYHPPVVRMKKDTVYITLKNETDIRLYYTILDIDGRNKVTVMMPKKGWSASEFVLEPGEVKTRRVNFDAAGREVLKLIATPMPIDLREAVERRGRDFRDRSFFETLFAHTYLERSGGRGPEERYKGNEAGVSTAVLEVVK